MYSTTICMPKFAQIFIVFYWFWDTHNFQFNISTKTGNMVARSGFGSSWTWDFLKSSWEASLPVCRFCINFTSKPAKKASCFVEVRYNMTTWPLNKRDRMWRVMLLLAGAYARLGLRGDSRKAEYRLVDQVCEISATVARACWSNQADDSNDRPNSIRTRPPPSLKPSWRHVTRKQFCYCFCLCWF